MKDYVGFLFLKKKKKSLKSSCQRDTFWSSKFCSTIILPLTLLQEISVQKLSLWIVLSHQIHLLVLTVGLFI